MKVLNSKVLIEIIKPDNKTSGGVILPDSKEQKKQGIVVSIGKDVKSVSVGDKVLYYDFESNSLSVKGKDYSVIDEIKILALIEDLILR